MGKKCTSRFANHAWQTGEYDHYVFLVVLAWGYFDLYGKTFRRCGRCFGTGNQLLATIALAVGHGVPESTWGKAEICVDYSGADVVCGYDYADGGSAFRSRIFSGR